MRGYVVHVGFGRFIEAAEIVAIVSPSSAPIQRLVREQRRQGIARDMTGGRRTKAAVFADSGAIVLASITPEALAGRVTAARAGRIVPDEAEE